MGFTDSYRKQHEELVDIVTKVSGLLDKSKISEHAGDISVLLSQLSAKLNVHLAMEDKALYPRLMNSKDQKCSSTAKQFFDEMGGIKDVFQKYLGKYSMPKQITDHADSFLKDTKDLFNALANRIDRENKILYPLADSAS